MATVILGIAAAGVLLPFSGGAVVRAEGYKRTLAVKLASDLMDQILSTDYRSIVAAYGSYLEAQGQCEDINGQLFTDSDSTYANFSRDSSCTEVYVSQQPGSVNTIFIRATVTVYYSGEQVVSISRLIGDYNANTEILDSWSFGP